MPTLDYIDRETSQAADVNVNRRQSASLEDVTITLSGDVSGKGKFDGNRNFPIETVVSKMERNDLESVLRWE